MEAGKSTDKSEPNLCFALLPLDAWNHILSYMSVAQQVFFTRCCSKSVLQWSLTTITEICAKKGVCAYSELSRPHLRRIALPFGAIGSPTSNYLANLGNASLSELELGLHPNFSLEAVFSFLPNLKKLHLGQYCSKTSSSWHFLPRQLTHLSLMAIDMRKKLLEPQDTSMEIYSPFIGMPSSIKEITMRHIATDPPLNDTIVDRHNFSDSLISYRWRFKDFIENCAMVLKNLEHICLPNYLALIFGVQGREDDFEEKKKVQNYGDTYEVEESIVCMQNLKYLSCSYVLWEDMHARLKDTKGNENIPCNIVAISGSKEVKSKSSANVVDLRSMTLMNIMPRLEHLYIGDSCCRKSETQLLFSKIEFLPPSLTSLHLLSLFASLPIIKSLQNSSMQAHHMAQNNFYALPPNLTSLSVPSLASLSHLQTKNHPLTSLSLTYSLMGDITQPTFFEALSSFQGLSSSLSHLNISEIRILPPQHPRDLTICPVSEKITRTFRKSLETRLPNVIQCTIGDNCVLMPYFLEIDPARGHMEAGKSKNFSDASSELLRRAKFVPSLFQFGIRGTTSIPPIEKVKHGALCWEKAFPQILEEIAVASREQFPLTPYAPFIHPILLLAFTENNELRYDIESLESKKNLEIFVSKFLRVNGGQLLHYHFDNFIKETSNNVDMLSIFLKFKIVPQEENQKNQKNQPRDELCRIFPLTKWETLDNFSDLLNTLVAYRIDLNRGDELGRTWLHRSIASRAHNTVHLLLQLKRHGKYIVDIDIKDSFGVTQRQEALSSGFKEIVQSMLERIESESNPSKNSSNIDHQKMEEVILNRSAAEGKQVEKENFLASATSSSQTMVVESGSKTRLKRKARAEAAWESFHGE